MRYVICRSYCVAILGKFTLDNIICLFDSRVAASTIYWKSRLYGKVRSNVLLHMQSDAPIFLQGKDVHVVVKSAYI